jgi:mitochondrial import inner membrane translocase subunit TIM54
MKLPSRNWSIFFAVTGSFTAAWLYDRHEKNKAQAKWCRLVSHLANEPIGPFQLQRKVTIFLAAPPGDGLQPARDYFREYVKPVLVSAALDWDVVEGRQEGDVRRELAELIREKRRAAGEGEQFPPKTPEEWTKQEVVESIRKTGKVTDFQGVRGDIVIGRNTWKEYIRGLHEGWLGPVDLPKPPPELPVEEAPLPPADDTAASDPLLTIHSSDGIENVDDASPSATSEPEKKEEDKPKAPEKPLPFISTLEYINASIPKSLPNEFEPVVPISFPHLLGFLKTPVRVYRWLNRRHLADSVGREVAAVVLASQSRDWESSSGISEFAGGLGDADDASSSDEAFQTADDTPKEVILYEQQKTLVEEEPDWPKYVRKSRDKAAEELEKLGVPRPESVLLDPMVIDKRLASRMRRFVLDVDDERRAEILKKGEVVEDIEKTDR